MIMLVNKRRYPSIALESLGSRLRMIYYENDEETATFRKNLCHCNVNISRIGSISLADAVQDFNHVTVFSHMYVGTVSMTGLLGFSQARFAFIAIGPSKCPGTA